jgi:hypothetical protein
MAGERSSRNGAWRRSSGGRFWCAGREGEVTTQGITPRCTEIAIPQTKNCALRQTLSAGRRSPLDGFGRRRLRQRDGRELLHTLECELLDRRRFKTHAEARMAVFEFIEGFYNPRRRHSSLGYLSPITFERHFAAVTLEPGAHQHAVVLTPVKERPGSIAANRAAGVPAVLDSRARRDGVGNVQGRDGKMPRGQTKRLPQRGGQNAVRPDTLIPRPRLSTKPGQAQTTSLGS